MHQNGGGGGGRRGRFPDQKPQFTSSGKDPVELEQNPLASEEDGMEWNSLRFGHYFFAPFSLPSRPFPCGEETLLLFKVVTVVVWSGNLSVLFFFNTNGFPKWKEKETRQAGNLAFTKSVQAFKVLLPTLLFFVKKRGKKIFLTSTSGCDACYLLSLLLLLLLSIVWERGERESLCPV